MSDLIIIGYDDESTADRVLDEVRELQHEYLIDLDDAAAVIRKADGKIKVDSPHHSIASGATWGVLWGTLFGLIFFLPILGLITGGVLGALYGTMTKAGIDDEFRGRVQDMLQPGTSAIVMIVHRSTPDKVLEALEPYGGTVLQTSLSHDAEEQLREALSGQTAGAAAS